MRRKEMQEEGGAEGGRRWCRSRREEEVQEG